LFQLSRTGQEKAKVWSTSTRYLFWRFHGQGGQDKGGRAPRKLSALDKEFQTLNSVATALIHRIFT